MKTKNHKFHGILVLAMFSLIIYLTGCIKDNDSDPKNTKTPVWVYNTFEDPYMSKPCVAGDKVIVCTGPHDQYPNSKCGTHCINRNTGALIWKVNDSVTEMITSPLVYNDLILEGGLNPHARRLSDGVFQWKFVDTLLAVSQYSNPLIVGDAAYFSCWFNITKLNAGSGAPLWQTMGMYNNLRLSAAIYKNGSIFYADASYYKVTSFDETSGAVEWEVPFENAFANKPLVTDNEFYVGIQDADINTRTLRCMNLSDRTEKWGVRLGSIVADLALADGKIYAIGMSTLNCCAATDGTIIWQHVLSAGAVSEPLITDNKVFVGYGNGFVCLNASTGELLWEYKTASGQDGLGFSSPTLDGDKIFVSCTDGNVYCFSVN
jgi:outer membrane protein assembly factor BamB